MNTELADCNGLLLGSMTESVLGDTMKGSLDEGGNIRTNESVAINEIDSE